MSHKIHYPKPAINDSNISHMPKKRLLRMITKLSLDPKSGDIIPTCYLCGKEFRYKTELKEHLNNYSKEQLINILSKWRTYYN